MGSKNCMNELCRATKSSEWKKGWSLKSGGFATLCYKCGSAYEGSIFCETFHLEEFGWRECRTCGKRIHCGCIGSRHLHEFLDFGGVGCISCEKQIISSKSVKVPNATFVTNGIRDVHPLVVDNKSDSANISTERLLHLTTAIGSSDMNVALEQLKREESFIQKQESIKHLPNYTKHNYSSPFAEGDKIKPKQEVKDMHESLAQPCLGFSLTTPLVSSTPLLAFPSGTVEGSEQSKGSLQQAQITRHILPRPPKPSHISTSELQKVTITQKRYARPPADGRSRTQLLPRYWPRVTDQELQQLSGDLKSTIVPLFEKILSASDAGRIGRLVLPKACAESYFPPINQSEGIPIRIQDIKGKEWTLQFRFWPNNNSRMYVLEGVTPCIQNMQMQAGDTVTFSRRDPGGQLVIGCRKATSNVDEQEAQTPATSNGDSPGETLADNSLSNGGRTLGNSIQRYTPMPEKKKMRNIKNKRLLMHTDDAFELRITWEEAQEFLRPSPAAKSTVVMVEDHEFEEFEEPPIFGKRTLFTSRPSGEMEQLAQCDSCSKWRRLPVHALLSAKWTCTENIWDSNRCSCSAPEDINPRDLDSPFGVNKDYRKRRISDENVSKEGEPCGGLDALATAAVLGDNIVEMGESSTSATTRHPRHRPGCTCIVCIQPPSGKGKHEPSCKCNVCLTVKRRFKTLMMRKKKRQSEREAEISLMKDGSTTNLSLEIKEFAGNTSLHMSHEENETNDMNMEESNKGQLDLNNDPRREDDILLEEVGMSLTTLMNAARLPVDLCFGQNHTQRSEIRCLPSRLRGDGEENGADEAE